MNVFVASVPHYIKYIDTPFKQLVLSSNGTLGGSSFACSAKSETRSNYAYHVFDSDKSNYWRGGSDKDWFIFYNPIPIRVSSILWGFYWNYPKGGYVEGSNDNSSWVKLRWISNGTGSDFNINVDSTAFYKYHRLSIEGTNNNGFVHIGNLTVSAVTRKEVEVTVNDDYDFIRYEKQYSVLGLGLNKYGVIK